MNKKLLFSLIAIAVFCGFVGFRDQQKGICNNPLGLMNIEALSTNENGYEIVVYVDYPWGPGCNCAGKGSLLCC